LALTENKAQIVCKTEKDIITAINICIGVFLFPNLEVFFKGRFMGVSLEIWQRRQNLIVVVISF